MIVSEVQPIRKERIQKKGDDLLRKIDWQMGVVSSQKEFQRRETTLKKLQRERADVLLRYFPKGALPSELITEQKAELPGDP